MEVVWMSKLEIIKSLALNNKIKKEYLYMENIKANFIALMFKDFVNLLNKVNVIIFAAIKALAY
jgi:hypothetical protein